MNERKLLFLRNEGIDPQKIEKACKHIFNLLEDMDFDLKDTKELISSMGSVIRDMTKNDPLRKIGRFDYSSSIEGMLSCNAASKTKS